MYKIDLLIIVLTAYIHKYLFNFETIAINIINLILNTAWRKLLYIKKETETEMFFSVNSKTVR